MELTLPRHDYDLVLNIEAESEMYNLEIKAIQPRRRRRRPQHSSASA